MYVFIAVGGFYIYIEVGFKRYIPGRFIDEYHKVIGTSIMCLGYLSFLLASWTNPGVIKKSNHKEAMKKF
jgi:drug/metabolite transporter superfamily protein YnfA